MAMVVTATYNDDFGRVQISFTGANGTADYATVEHSLDQINWSTIRGGDTVPLSGGSGHIDHYDGYTFGVANYYRVTAIDVGQLPSLVSVGVAATGNNTSVVPAHPAVLAVGDLKLILASIRTGTVNVPAGWTKMAESGNFTMLGKIHQSGDVAPTVTFSGGVANADTMAQMATLRYAKLITTSVNSQANPSNQNVAFPTITLHGPGALLYLGWKQDDMTSSAVPTFATKIGDVSSTAGDDASMFWDYFAVPPQNEGLSFGGDTVAITGGAAAISRAISVQVPADPTTDATSISYTPVFPNKNRKPYWLMNPARPGQNIRVEITAFSEITQGGRTGIFEIVGRSAPVTVSDIMESGSFDFTIDAATKSEAKEIAARLALGDPMFLLVPDPNADIDTFYFTATALKRAVDAPGGSWSVTVSAREVSQPAPAVYGSTYIWNDVATDYASWTSVLADPQNATWSNLVDRISDDIIVVP
jgi:hypothetical protein